ncbi:hypothetical protein M011DRAFT_463612 [Sporormia fimetaria CBS 119925]|uniref:Uncharacterized protein n=1 Tax=Sporormia fimetaria CBS 119925 TaxID=1340428 RepID=A0A6A6VSC2_9PLEO|nr:hypothetical protein M011DRAFT_463612 [Sporormia fimetaria CBS 119925]
MFACSVRMHDAPQKDTNAIPLPRFRALGPPEARRLHVNNNPRIQRNPTISIGVPEGTYACIPILHPYPTEPPHQ